MVDQVGCWEGSGSALFSASNQEMEGLERMLTLSNSMGLMLQKNDIPRACRENLEDGPLLLAEKYSMGQIYLIFPIRILSRRHKDRGSVQGKTWVFGPWPDSMLQTVYTTMRDMRPKRVARWNKLPNSSWWKHESNLRRREDTFWHRRYHHTRHISNGCLVFTILWYVAKDSPNEVVRGSSGGYWTRSIGAKAKISPRVDL